MTSSFEQSNQNEKMASAGRTSIRILICFISVAVQTVKPLPWTENNSKRSDAAIPDEKWGYVTVRKGAHMFWWLYGAQSTVKPRTDAPLVIWLQGGPGGSGTGFGNFKEIGPLDDNMQKRNTTWLQVANLLFIDNPVGTGFSYVDSVDALCTNISQIADDLVTLMKSFVSALPIFQTLPIYVFSESYGGKMTSAFGWRLYEAIGRGEIKCNLAGVALGDSWISPVDSVITWAPFLYQYNLLDAKDYQEVMSFAEKTVLAVSEKRYLEATGLWGQTENVIDRLTDSVNVYNVLQHHMASPTTLRFTGNKIIDALYKRHAGIYHAKSLSDFMNTVIRKKLGIIPDNVSWGGQSNLVFKYQSTEFMKPVTKQVSQLLNANVNVVVYQGQLDMICDTAGAELWLKKLTWSGMDNYFSASRKPLYLPGDKTKNTAAFLKEYKNLKMYYIMKAGHMVPSDQGEMALQMVIQVINNSS